MARQYDPAGGRFDRRPASAAAATHSHAATDVTSGTLATDRYSAYADLSAETKIGTGSTQVAAGDHTHAYAAASHEHAATDITSGTLSTDRFSAYDDLTAESKVGTGSTQVAAGDHTHTGATISTTTYTAASVTVQTGTLATGHTVTRTQTRDGDSLQVTEATGADPLRVDVGFTGVASFNAVVFHGEYDGSTSHVMQLELYNVSRTEWEVLAVIESRTTARWYTVHVYNPAAYLDSGAVTLRFNHLSNGTSSHNLYVDYIALQRLL